MTWRIRLLTVGLISLWGVIAVRLTYLQVWQHAEFVARTVRQQRYVETIPARPGDLVDRRGNLLATTIKVRSLYVDPSQIDSAAAAAALAEALRLEEDQLRRHIAAHADRRFLWIKRRLTGHEEQRLLNAKLQDGAWGFREEFQRRYPHRHLAAHVLGWRNIDGVGQAGVERSLEDRLAGRDGQRTLVRDARGYVLDVLEEVTRPPVHGDPVALTIDLSLQAFVEEQLDLLLSRWRPKSASVIVLDPRTGDVLSMASRPTFDPNAPADSLPNAWINRAVAQAYEPGSTLKPIIAAWAVDSRAVSRDELFDCGHGELRMGSRLLHDTHPYGDLTLGGILVKSSNIGMARVGQRMGNDGLQAAVRAFGFGRRTGIQLPDESTGLVRPPEEWDAFSTGSVPMGQELAATPLQIIRAHAALAAGGTLRSPQLVAQSQDGRSRPGSVLVTRAVAQETADWLVQVPLADVVRSGTGRRAQLEGVNVFAKTGTAQKYDAQIGGYATDRYVSSCVCGAPAEAPKALVLVTVDEAQSEREPYGGVVAAPTAARILKRTLDLLDDHTSRSPRPAVAGRVSPVR